jgi:hypothetical protein
MNQTGWRVAAHIHVHPYDGKPRSGTEYFWDEGEARKAADTLRSIGWEVAPVVLRRTFA